MEERLDKLEKLGAPFLGAEEGAASPRRSNIVTPVLTYRTTPTTSLAWVGSRRRRADPGRVALCDRRAKKKDVEQSYENGRKTLPAAKVSLKKFEGKAGEVRGAYPPLALLGPAHPLMKKTYTRSIVNLCVARVPLRG